VSEGRSSVPDWVCAVAHHAKRDQRRSIQRGMLYRLLKARWFLSVCGAFLDLYEVAQLRETCKSLASSLLPSPRIQLRVLVLLDRIHVDGTPPAFLCVGHISRAMLVSVLESSSVCRTEYSALIRHCDRVAGTEIPNCFGAVHLTSKDSQTGSEPGCDRYCDRMLVRHLPAHEPMRVHSPWVGERDRNDYLFRYTVYRDRRCSSVQPLCVWHASLTRNKDNITHVCLSLGCGQRGFGMDFAHDPPGYTSAVWGLNLRYLPGDFIRRTDGDDDDALDSSVDHIGDVRVTHCTNGDACRFPETPCA
jgi:hypothetical protein